MELSSYQKQALLKIAVDLVKADNQIHRNEVAALNRLQRQYQITAEEVDLSHYLSLQQAVAALAQLGEGERVAVVGLLADIVNVDNDVSASESVLLAAVSLALQRDSSAWAQIMSVENMGGVCPDNQIIYLERGHCAAAHEVLGDRYDNLLITKALGDVGLHLFYLPNVVNELSERQGASRSRRDKYDLLGRSIGFIVPNGDGSASPSLAELMGDLNTERFMKVVATNFQITPDRFPFEAFLLVMVQDGHTLDDRDMPVRTVDFLCIDVSVEVKRRILAFVGMMERTVSLIPYEGYYKLLYEHLSSQSRIMSEVLLNDRLEFLLPDLGGEPIAFVSSPQARSFYLLLLKFGKVGVSKDCFNGALQLLEDAVEAHGAGEELLAALAKEESEAARMLYDLMVIYAYVSGKSVSDQGFYGYIRSIIEHRSSLKNYINKGFAAVPNLANAEQYGIGYDYATTCYYVRANIALFGFRLGHEGAVTRLAETGLWGRLR